MPQHSFHTNVLHLLIWAHAYDEPPNDMLLDENMDMIWSLLRFRRTINSYVIDLGLLLPLKLLKHAALSFYSKKEECFDSETQ